MKPADGTVQEHVFDKQFKFNQFYIPSQVEHASKSIMIPHEQAYWKFGLKSLTQSIKVLGSS